MGLFDKPRNKAATCDEVPVHGWEIIKVKIDTSQTPEKYQNMKDEVCSFLITNLLSLNDLETEYFKKQEWLESDKERLGIPSNQVHPKDDELWEEYHKKCDEIVTSVCTKPFDKRSMGKPAEYDYLNYDDTKILFIMKSASRAVVEMYFDEGIKQQQQFVLKGTEDGWKIDKKCYGFQSNNKWLIDHTV